MMGAARFLKAEEFSWKEVQSGSFGDRSRWLMNQGGIGVQAPRPPGAEDTVIFRDGDYIVTINGESTGTVFAASDNTLNIAGSFAVNSLVGSPMVVGSGVMTIGDWSLSPSAVDHLHALVAEAMVTTGSLRLPGSNLGVEIRNGGVLQCQNYVHGGGFGSKPIFVRGPGSSFEVQNDITVAPQLEIRVSDGALALLEGVLGTPGATGLPEFYIEGGGRLSTTDLTTNKLLLTDGGKATTAGNAWLSGTNNTVSNGSRWDVHRKLTLLGVFGQVLVITGNSIVNTDEVELGDRAEVFIEGGNGESLLFAKTKLTKRAATVRAVDGLVGCGSADLLPGEASLGQVSIDMTRSTFLVEGTAVLDSWARFQGEGAEFLATTCVIGSLSNRQGRLELLPGSDLAAVEPLVVGAAGRGTVTVRGAVLSDDLTAIIAGEAGSTGQFSLVEGATLNAAGAWVVGLSGNGTLTLGGGSLMRLSDDNALIVAGGAAGSEGTVIVEGGSEISNQFMNNGLPDIAFNATLVIGDEGKGTLVVRDGTLALPHLRVGRSSEENSVTVSPGPLQGKLELDDLILGDGGRGRMKFESRSSMALDELTVGKGSSLESLLSVDRGATVLCTRDITIGDSGRGSAVCSGTLSANREIRVAATNGAVGYLEASGQGAEVSGEGGRIVIGGGNGSSANAVISLGGRFFGAELSMPPPPSGTATLTVSGTGSNLFIYNKLEIGRLGRASGPATCTISGGAKGYAGRALLVGPTGVLSVLGGGMLVSPIESSPVKPGVVRVEAGAHFGLAGQLIGDTEIAPGASFSPGASPGTAEVQGGMTLESGSRLDLEIGGPDPGTGYDVIRTTGPLSVRGTVRLRFINGFAPMAGQSFTLVRSEGALVWTPTQVTVEGLGTGFAFTLLPGAAGTVTLIASNTASATSQPELDIALNGVMVELSWPAVPGWILEQSRPGALTPWSTVLLIPAPEAGYYFLSRPLDPQNPAPRFFRLRKSP
ncbi:MAG: hypothetical protein ACKV19_05645 [Verrucomicrobiales bacterium]